MDNDKLIPSEDERLQWTDDQENLDQLSNNDRSITSEQDDKEEINRITEDDDLKISKTTSTEEAKWDGNIYDTSGEKRSEEQQDVTSKQFSEQIATEEENLDSKEDMEADEEENKVHTIHNEGNKELETDRM